MHSVGSGDRASQACTREIDGEIAENHAILVNLTASILIYRLGTPGLGLVLYYSLYYTLVVDLVIVVV